MLYCYACNFKTNSKFNFDRHNQTKKHEEKIKTTNALTINKKNICPGCGKYFNSTGGNYYNHLRKCHIDLSQHQEINNLKSETKIKELEHQLELERMKSSFQQVLNNKELNYLSQKHELELELVSNKNTQHTQHTSNSNNFNQQINITGDNQFITNKKDILNVHFNKVIDIDTFTNNYKNGYGLTFDESRILLENCKMSGIKSCAPNLTCFLKRSYVRQYKDIYGTEPEPNEIVLPFILNDSGLRRHYEKTNEGWNSTTSMDNIHKFIVISNDLVFNAHKQYIPISAYEKITVSNSLLRLNNYESLIANSKKELTMQ
uniref:C2H2-type domain-containing protein n=1 Tax=viral metagenome TaxID=1070528 RepID=A0A6C0E7I2_9ZZZZ